MALAGPPTASERVERIVRAAGERGLNTPTLKQIMREPRWVSRPAEGAYWADDGQSILYRRDRAEGVLSDQYRLALDGVNPLGEAEIVPDEELPVLSARGGDVTDDKQWKVSSRGGDLYLKHLTTGTEQQLTRTRSGESGPEFIRGGAAVVFSRSGSLIVRDLVRGVEEEVADLRAEDQPKDPEADKKEKKGLDAQQERLFAVVRDREADAEERRVRREEVDEANTTGVPGPFYLGKKRDIRQRALSEDGAWLAVSLRKQQDGGKRDVMPSYVNDDGYVSTRPVRPKVGIGPRGSSFLTLIDLGNQTTHEIDWAQLPMVSNDPLAWLSEQGEPDAAVDETADGGTGGQTGAEPSATEAEAAGGVGSDIGPAETPAEEPDEAQDEAVDDGDDAAAKESDAKPRAVNVYNVSWSPTGLVVAATVRSSDNKDRWIVAIDVSSGEPEVTVVEHQREEGWINWSFNETGWLPDGRLWFTSEKSGYSRLFAWDGEATLLTGDGEFTVGSVSASPDGDFLYYRSNRTHPTEYELERVNTGTGMVSAVTGMGGSVDSYRLSPSGDRVLLTHSTSMDPPELYVVNADGEEASGEPTRLTHTDEAGFRAFDLVTPAFVEVPSTHTELPVHARVYEDPDAPSRNAGQGKPVVVFVHGAGYTQHVYKGWSYYFREHLFHTLLARAGYIVIAPDFRASAGYGSDWRQAVYRNMGEPELQDLDDCLEWLKAECGADTSRVGIYGGSYGGFLSLMAMFDRPGVYAAGAALRPVTDWAHYNDGYTANILNTPQVDPEAYLRSSPIEKAEGFRENGAGGRLLILHGMLDDNVVFQDSVRLAQRLIELEKENWELAAYPVEPHGFVESTGWLDEYRRIFRMFEEELGTD